MLGFVPKRARPRTFNPRRRYIGENRRQGFARTERFGHPPLPVIASKEWGIEQAWKTIGLLRDYRKDHKIPGQHVAESMGVSQAVIARLERQQVHDMSFATLLRYLRVLDLDVEIVRRRFDEESPE